MKSVALTDVGKQREVNQDYVWKSDGAVGKLPNLYIVADGMGGHKAGDYASRFCVEDFVNEVRKSSIITNLGIIEASIGVVNEHLLTEMKNNPDYEGMGTTMVLMYTENGKCTIANVGDSRMYICSQDELIQITKDHSLVEEMIEKGELDRRDAARHPRKNVITRAFGQQESLLPDCYEIDITDGDILLLCSDGLCNMIEEESMEAVLKDLGLSLEKKAEALINMANERGGKDNISLVMVEI